MMLTLTFILSGEKIYIKLLTVAQCFTYVTHVQVHQAKETFVLMDPHPGFALFHTTCSYQRQLNKEAASLLKQLLVTTCYSQIKFGSNGFRSSGYCLH